VSGDEDEEEEEQEEGGEEEEEADGKDEKQVGGKKKKKKQKKTTDSLKGEPRGPKDWGLGDDKGSKKSEAVFLLWKLLYTLIPSPFASAYTNPLLFNGPDNTKQQQQAVQMRETFHILREWFTQRKPDSKERYVFLFQAMLMIKHHKDIDWSRQRLTDLEAKIGANRDLQARQQEANTIRLRNFATSPPPVIVKPSDLDKHTGDRTKDSLDFAQSIKLGNPNAKWHEVYNKYHEAYIQSKVEERQQRQKQEEDRKKAIPTSKKTGKRKEPEPEEDDEATETDESESEEDDSSDDEEEQEDEEEQDETSMVDASDADDDGDVEMQDAGDRKTNKMPKKKSKSKKIKKDNKVKKTVDEKNKKQKKEYRPRAPLKAVQKFTMDQTLQFFSQEKPPGPSIFTIDNIQIKRIFDLPEPHCTTAGWKQIVALADKHVWKGPFFLGMFDKKKPEAERMTTQFRLKTFFARYRALEKLQMFFEPGLDVCVHDHGKDFGAAVWLKIKAVYDSPMSQWETESCDGGNLTIQPAKFQRVHMRSMGVVTGRVVDEEKLKKSKNPKDKFAATGGLRATELTESPQLAADIILSLILGFIMDPMWGDNGPWNRLVRLRDKRVFCIDMEECRPSYDHDADVDMDTGDEDPKSAEDWMWDFSNTICSRAKAIAETTCAIYAECLQAADAYFQRQLQEMLDRLRSLHIPVSEKRIDIVHSFVQQIATAPLKTKGDKKKNKNKSKNKD
jgi:hypothetical protein